MSGSGKHQMNQGFETEQPIVRATLSIANSEASSEWNKELGDDDPWVRYLATAWRAAATTATDVPLPARPHGGTDDDLAYWGPLIPLVSFGLGWSRPDLGLQRWLAESCPTDDPILSVVDRWWGRDGITDFMAWVVSWGGLKVPLASRQAAPHYLPFPPHRYPPADSDELRQRRVDPEWLKTWSDTGDSMHLTGHVGAPLVYENAQPTALSNAHQIDPRDTQTIPRLQITTPTYTGWYTHFASYPTGVGANGRSVRTDVVVKPIGWMGEFRQHTTTRLWFRGRASVHLWGQEPV